MNGNTFFSRMVRFFRAGYPADAPQLGHVALIAMCPAAHSVARPSSASETGLCEALLATTMRATQHQAAVDDWHSSTGQPSVAATSAVASKCTNIAR
jgi:hypothetical protein